MREWLRAKRRSEKLTQAKIAGAMGISQRYYCDIEAGIKKELSLRQAVQLSVILGVSMEQIIAEEEKLKEE